MKKYSVCTGLLLIGLAAIGSGFVSAAPPVITPSTARVRLPGHLSPKALQGAVRIGRKGSSETVPLALTLPLRDPAGLEVLLRRLYTPGDPLFHHFLTPAEFADRFSPTPATYAEVTEFAKLSGFSVTGTHTNRLLLEVSAPASTVEAAFHVQIEDYTAADGRSFHAPDREPSVPAALAGKIAGVVGLQDSAVLRPHLVRREPSFLPDEIGSDPNDGALTPSDIKTAYSLDQTTLTGTGRTLGLLELDGFTASDIAAYEAAYSLPQVPLDTILTGGATGVPGDPLVDEGPAEVTLDIELMTALAPGASAIRVYEAPRTDAGVLAAFTQIADDNAAKEVSTSWGQPEDASDPVTLAAENVLFMQMAGQGQSLYAASADQGAYDDGATLSVDDPSSQPFVSGVGGTTLNVVRAGGAYQAEAAWGDPTDTSKSPKGSGGGGGVSGVWTIPSYQSSVTGLVSTTYRNVPDVSLDSNPNTGYSVYYNNQWNIFGGTSCAAPLWAAFTALVNQKRKVNQQPDLGFPNTAIYQIGTGTSYHSGFHDVDDGTTNLFYPANPGYDNATGWGSFNGASLLTLLAPAVVVSANPLSALTITPSSVVGGLSAAGKVTLTNPAPTGGAVVALAAGTGPATVPVNVTVAAGASSATFTITTLSVTASTPVTVTASYSGGSLSAGLTVTPPPATITPVSLTLTPASVGGGTASTATVLLSGPAPAAGLTVALTSSDPAAIVPASVVVPSGSVSAQLSVPTAAVSTTVVATLSATLNAVTQTATLTVQAPALERIALSPASVIGGQSASEALTLTFPALTGGAPITLTSSDPSASVPADVTIATGQTTVTVPVTTTAVSIPTSVTLTAAYAGVTQTTTLTVGPVQPAGLTLTPSSVIGSLSTVGVLTLNAPAPAGGLTATLTGTSPAVLLPATLAIPAGATTVSFPIPTAAVPAAVTASVTVMLNGAGETASLTLQPIQITALSVTPASAVTGSPITGSFTLNAPAPPGGLTVALASSTASATVPATLPVPAGVSTLTFPIATPHAGSAIISASLAGTPLTATLIVNAAPGTSYPAGLNLISAPYDYPAVPLDSLFGYTGVVLATWQTATGAYALSPTAPADALRLGRGYWVNLPAAETLTSVGTPADPTQDFTLALAPGWNQIGVPFTSATTVSRLSLTTGSAPIAFDQASSAAPLVVSALVYRYSPGQGKTPGSYVWVRDTDSIQPGLGYWIYAYQAATLTVPHP